MTSHAAPSSVDRTLYLALDISLLQFKPAGVSFINMCVDICVKDQLIRVKYRGSTNTPDPSIAC